MRLTLRDGRDGAWRELAPVAPPVLTFRTGPTARERAIAALWARAVAYLGWEPRESEGAVDLAVGGSAPRDAAAWLKVAPETGSAPPSPGLDFLRVRTHYAVPLSLSPASIAAAEQERGRLLAHLSALEEAPGAASPRAIAGYGGRIREALARDLDAPRALQALWDALKPGALSPGSRAALLKEALPLFI